MKVYLRCGLLREWITSGQRISERPEKSKTARRVVHPGEPAQGRDRGGPGSCVARRWGITSPGDKRANAGDEDRF